jgi:hypothetical protein
MAIQVWNSQLGGCGGWDDKIPLGIHYQMWQLKRFNAESGQHWFSPDTMRFFRSRVGDTVYAHPEGWLFVSSERFETHYPRYHTEPRRYTVRIMLPNGHVETLNASGQIDSDGFQLFASSSGAHAAARRIAKAGASIEGKDYHRTEQPAEQEHR